MPSQSRRAALCLSDEVRAGLTALSKPRTACAAHVQRAQMLLAYAATSPHTSRHMGGGCHGGRPASSCS